MLYAQKVRAELDSRRDQLAAYQDHYGSQLAAYRAALAALGGRFPSVAALSAAQQHKFRFAQPAADHAIQRIEAGRYGNVIRQIAAYNLIVGVVQHLRECARHVWRAAYRRRLDLRL